MMAGKTAIVMLLLCVLASVAFAQEASPDTDADVWIMPPPWPGNGQPLKEMIADGDAWAQTRGLVRGIGYWPWFLNDYHSDDEIRSFFSRIVEWDLDLGFEIPVVKYSVGEHESRMVDAEQFLGALHKQVERFRGLGMPRVIWFAFDEPLYAARHVIPSEDTPEERLTWAITETVTFITQMRTTYPGSALGDIEPYPALTEEEILGSIESIQKTCAERGVQGLDFLRLDVDWDRMEQNKEGSWAGVKRIEDRCRALGLTFSLIYWSADEPRLTREGLAGPEIWRKGILKQREAYAQAGGKPDQIVIESWLHVPVKAIPETDPDTFTGSVRAFFAEE